MKQEEYWTKLYRCYKTLTELRDADSNWAPLLSGPIAQLEAIELAYQTLGKMDVFGEVLWPDGSTREEETDKQS